MEFKWYVIYTKHDLEKRVSDILTRKKIENYYPVITEPVKYGDNKKIKEIPLFKGYVFVKTTESYHEELKKISGVINLVYWLGNPVCVKNAEIKAMKLFLNDYNNITIEKTDIKRNERMSEGILPEQEAPLVTIKNKKAYVAFPSLGYTMTADVETPNVRIISPEGVLNSTKSNKLFDKVSVLNNSLKGYWAKQ